MWETVEGFGEIHETTARLLDVKRKIHMLCIMFKPSDYSNYVSDWSVTPFFVCSEPTSGKDQVDHSMASTKYPTPFSSTRDSSGGTPSRERNIVDPSGAASAAAKAEKKSLSPTRQPPQAVPGMVALSSIRELDSSSFCI